MFKLCETIVKMQALGFMLGASFDYWLEKKSTKQILIVKFAFLLIFIENFTKK